MKVKCAITTRLACRGNKFLKVAVTATDRASAWVSTRTCGHAPRLECWLVKPGVSKLAPNRPALLDFSDFQNLRWGTRIACWWGDPTGWVCKPTQEVTPLRNRCFPWQPERIVKGGVR
eukprot:1161592-Pelagomonas_calceolata.AAC.1